MNIVGVLYLDVPITNSIGTPDYVPRLYQAAQTTSIIRTLGFTCLLVSDACVTPVLEFDSWIIVEKI